MKRETYYLNTDLDLVAPFDLTPLADALIQRGLLSFFVLQREDRLWSGRSETEEPFLEPDQNIAAMLTAIESLDEPMWNLWTACTIREFDIGYDCGEEPHSFTYQLSAATLARIAAAGAAVRITLYPIKETDASEVAFQHLKKDKSIRKHLGKLTSYNHASVKEHASEVEVNLYGNKGISVFVRCRMELNNQEKWVLKEILKKEEKVYLPKPA